MNPYLVQVWDCQSRTLQVGRNHRGTVLDCGDDRTHLKTKSFTSKRQAFKYAKEIRNTGDGYEYSAHVYEYLPTEIN